MSDYAQGYHIRTILSGGFCHSQTGPKGKAGGDHSFYHLTVYLSWGWRICDGGTFFGAGDQIFSLGKLTITREGVKLAVLLSVRLGLLIIGSSVMTLTTTPNQLTDGLEKMLKPLNKLKVPVHEIAMMMSIALRFIPILMEETDKIMKAQLARCADFESGNLIRKAKSLVPLLVPLFISAFRRANDLAMAMEARCYRGGEHRTKMKPLHYEKRDYMAYLVVLCYLAAGVVLGKLLPI